QHVRRTEPGAVLLELPCAARADLDRRDLAGGLRRLPARRRAEIQGSLALATPHAETRQLRAPARRPAQALPPRRCVHADAVARAGSTWSASGISRSGWASIPP